MASFWLSWKDVSYAPTFSQRVPDVTLAQIAKDFGIHVVTLDKWLRQARIENGEKPGVTRSENDELRELRLRNRLLE